MIEENDSKLDLSFLIDVKHCLQIIDALAAVLGEATMNNGEHHHGVQVSIIQEYVMRAEKLLEGI